MALPAVAASIARSQKGSGDRWKDNSVRVLCLLCAAISIFVTAAILGVLLREAFLFFTKVSPRDFFTGTEWAPTYANSKFGVLPLVAGTLQITVGSALISVPLGLLSAIYLA
ncbi:MAG: phosphate ABC transporter permease subunit PstC, partial [Armatimonadota bacterium]